MDKTIRHEMAITRKEFFRLLPAAVQDRNYRITDNVIDIRDGAGTITIELETESRRTIASQQHGAVTACNHMVVSATTFTNSLASYSIVLYSRSVITTVSQNPLTPSLQMRMSTPTRLSPIYLAPSA